MNIPDLLNVILSSDLLKVILSSALTSAIVSSVISNMLAYRKMRYERNEDKALEVYDECLSALGEFRCKPDLVLDDAYIIRLMSLSPKLNAYGVQAVYEAVSAFFNFSNEVFQNWQEAKSQLEKQYWREESRLDSNGELNTTYYCIDSAGFENAYAEMKSKYTPSFSTAKKQVDKVSKAIFESTKVRFSPRRY